jgi:hypothetical protein
MRHVIAHHYPQERKEYISFLIFMQLCHSEGHFFADLDGCITSGMQMAKSSGGLATSFEDRVKRHFGWSCLDDFCISGSTI